MGSVCCVDARDKPNPNRARAEIMHTNSIHSPSWSFHWENRGRVAGEINNASLIASPHVSRGESSERKEALCSERGNLSGGSPKGGFGTLTSQKSSHHEGMGATGVSPYSDTSMSRHYLVEVNLAESPGIADGLLSKVTPITSSLSTPTDDHPSFRSHLLPPYSTPSRRASSSSGNQLLRQVSDSRILGLKSSISNFTSEGRSSFVLSSCSNDVTAGSQGGSSDGWSVNAFPELVASCQRERWSIDSENLSSARGKLSNCSSRASYSPSVDLQACGVCSKLLTERSSWCSNELSAVAVLVCGHLFHAECLETITAEADKYDPSCPLCTVGERQVTKTSKRMMKELRPKHHRISRNRVVDSYVDGGCDVFDHQKNTDYAEKVPKMGSCSSSKSSFAKPFLKKHFSFGSKRAQLPSDIDSSRRKSFWTRHRKD